MIKTRPPLWTPPQKKSSGCVILITMTSAKTWLNWLSLCWKPSPSTPRKVDPTARPSQDSRSTSLISELVSVYSACQSALRHPFRFAGKCFAERSGTPENYRSLSTEHCLCACPEPQSFIGACIGPILYIRDIFVRYLAKIRSFWLALPHQAVGVHVQPAFPGMIGFGEE